MDYYNCCSWGWSYYDWLLLQSWIKASHRQFLDIISPPNFEPNPLKILMRAINVVRRWVFIFQPCWSARRWKSLT